MNTEIEKLTDFKLTSEEEQEVLNMAACGLMPVEIAMTFDWPDNRRRLFCMLAEMAGSPVESMIASGRATGRAMTQVKLFEKVQAGHTDAIKVLTELQSENRFMELLTHMDDDELAY